VIGISYGKISSNPELNSNPEIQGLGALIEGLAAAVQQK
jgi:hypothetical protein